jgi:hypothetical protein
VSLRYAFSDSEAFATFAAHFRFGSQIWPQPIPKDVEDPEKLAIISCEPNAEEHDSAGTKEQGFHCDSHAQGGSTLTAMARDQEVLIMLHSFRATCILKTLLPDRKAATDHVRRLLAPETVFTDDVWADTAEDKAWQWLVCKEFEAQGLPPFEVVRVPIKTGQTIVIDNRCVHAGAAWNGRVRAYRAHTYGYVGNLQLRGDDAMLEKDHHTTVNILAGELSPIGAWAQRSGLFA